MLLLLLILLNNNTNNNTNNNDINNDDNSNNDPSAEAPLGRPLAHHAPRCLPGIGAGRFCCSLLFDIIVYYILS